MIDVLTPLCQEDKMLNYKNVLVLIILLISFTPVCPLWLAVQSGCSEGHQSSRWLPSWWMMGTGGADLVVIRTLSWQGLPLRAWAQSHGVDRERWMCGSLDGWMDEGKTDKGESYGTRRNLSLCVISSPFHLCAFLSLSMQPAEVHEECMVFVVHSWGWL